MSILCPTPPYKNSARSIINSTRYLINQNFEIVENILKKILIHQDKLTEILRLLKNFPDKTIQSVLQLRLSGETMNELNQWIGYMKSRLGHFLNDCQYECNLFVQTNNSIKIQNENLESFYWICFQLNEQILCRHRQFCHCLNKFFDQLLTCPFRTDTMKISYKLMSVENWIKEHKE